MSKLELLKFLEGYDGEVEIADFSPEELQELIERMKKRRTAPAFDERGIQKKIF